MANSEIYDLEVKTIDGKKSTLADYKGKAMLVVNVASKCGFTPQYKGLEELYKKYREQGFAVLGFPCNQFGAQEPGDETEIKNFCSLTYEVDFPMFAKVDVNGDHAAPLFQYLKKEKKGILWSEGIKWNFTKFLIGRDGTVLKRFAPGDKPENLTGDIEAALAAKV
jgi:glutathione peroxidase